GIRAGHVTGVQTCALPILRRPQGQFDSGLLLLAVALIAMVIPGSDVASSQTGPGAAAPPLFAAIDLNPSGFVESWASGTSSGQRSEERRVGKEGRGRGTGE